MIERIEMEQVERERKTLYILGWCLLGLAILYKGISTWSGTHLENVGLPCLFHAMTGLYCPGCGGTRAVEALLSGRVLLSLYYHPFVCYSLFLYLWFMVSMTLEYASRGRWKIGMQFCRWQLNMAIIILALNFIIKNGVMLLWHYPMLR